MSHQTILEALAKCVDGQGDPVGVAASFVCPHCGAFAQHAWACPRDGLVYTGSANGVKTRRINSGLRMILAACIICDREAVIINGVLAHPAHSSAPPPVADMPTEILGDFEEARLIVQFSPRGAAALLRLAIQKLLPKLGAKKTDINGGIAELVASGVISASLQKALDLVRVVGNEAVHPGEMDLRDDASTAHALFGLINFIVQRGITEPKEIEELYEKLPANKLAGIAARDGATAVAEIKD